MGDLPVESAESPTQPFDDADVRARFVKHYETLRGKVRQEIVRRHLHEVTLAGQAGRSLQILDVGCGDGRDSLWLLELGHDVTAIDSSREMLETARRNLDAASAELDRGRIRFLHGTEHDALREHGPEAFDVVLSHGVIMYHPDPDEFVRTHLALLKPDGTFSLLAKNAEALAYRSAAEGEWRQAMKLLDDSQGPGQLGVDTTAHTVQQIADTALSCGATIRSWAGVRIFTDTNVIDSEVAEPERALELEWKACRRDPYRRSAALIHLLLLKGLDLDLLPPD